MTNSNFTRRGILAWALGALGLSAAGRSALAAAPTPSATEGPFYPTQPMRRADVDNDLVKIMGKVHEAGGEVFTLRGRVMDADGQPLNGMRIEIWQCDMNGKYLHPGDSQNIDFDAAFQGFGHDITGTDGSYEFRTIKPVTYPGRTPHIHVKVFDGETEILTSQFYIDGHPANDRDRIFGRLSQSEAKAVSMVFTQVEDRTEAQVDVILPTA
ncbi:protocatechuate 3,4-dioxygenase beta subunit [Pacificibacter maritimus]|uniref:Protocatechuate 3,4-dioxygenase beta subunit n=1 Tax=Pacificibacter maritimus TaxID=762213 RepID=A0A3N4USD1_9RHOB|nr:protocatechuate 3,4-dioxygenase [Pacificibacter maritimus]RPE71595.1 protocatechuate 3,4-dioxygenase beta subunit [Pacificibacter maritimus]